MSVGVAIYGWKAATREGNKHSTIQNLKMTAAVEIQYYSTHNRRFGTFDEMVKEQLIPPRFTGNPVIADGYILTLTVMPTSPSSFILRADPQEDAGGNSHFYLDSSDSDSIRVNPNKPAGPNDPVLSY